MFGHDGFSVILCNLNLRIYTFRFSLISVADPSYFLCVRDSPKSFWYDRCFWNDWQNSDNLQSFLHCCVVTILQNDKWRKINQTASKYSALIYQKKKKCIEYIQFCLEINQMNTSTFWSVGYISLRHPWVLHNIMWQIFLSFLSSFTNA